MAPCLAKAMAIPDWPTLFLVDAEGRERFAKNFAAAALTSPSTVSKASVSRFFLVYYFSAASISTALILSFTSPGTFLHAPI